jgi:hypothetical protein
MHVMDLSFGKELLVLLGLVLYYIFLLAVVQKTIEKIRVKITRNRLA